MVKEDIFLLIPHVLFVTEAIPLKASNEEVEMLHQTATMMGYDFGDFLIE